MLTIAVGDVHGCLHKLVLLSERCRRASGAGNVKYVFFGDYLDRGANSREVVEFLIDLQSRRPGDVIGLCGDRRRTSSNLYDPICALPADGR